MTDIDEIKAWQKAIEAMIGLIVEEPDSVVVSIEGLPGSRVFAVGVAEKDVGRVIGRGSRTLRALTGLTHSWAKMRGWQADLTLLNPRELPPGSRDPGQPFGRRYRDTARAHGKDPRDR